MDEDESEVVESWLRAAAHVSVHLQPPLSVGSELGSGRFVVKRRIGAGGMGIVFDAFDRERNAHVALKMLTRADAASIYRLKKEFRALADVIHPNLIRLHELFVSDQESFFTMDLLEGTSFLEHVRAAPVDSREHVLRSAFHDLAVGVDAIHRGGKLHRDLKPSNVLVTTEGRVVILDFGLADDAVHRGQQTIEEGVLGTPAYMAPEQARAEPATAASDWYAVGVMLYEALTERIPFDGSVYEILTAKQTSDPPVPIDATGTIQPDLGSLCQELMRRQPSERPSADQVLATLAPGRGVDLPLSRAPVSTSVFVGRGHEMLALREAVAATDGGKPGVIYLHGLSGVGKTALIDAFVHNAQAESRALVLRGRCYERESLPFRALDMLIDDLSRHLRSISDLEVARVTPRHVHALLRVFPVLQRVAQLANAPERTALPDNPVEVRRRAFAALSQLLGNLAAARPVVLIIDDLQWADDDSALVLCDLLRPPNAPALLFIGCYRSDEVERRRPLQTLLTLRAGDSEVDARELPLGPLSDEESHELVSALLGDEGELHRIATHDAHGNPFFLTELVRYVQLERHAAPASAKRVLLTLEQMLQARRRRLPEQAQRLLEAACVAGRPTALRTLTSVLGDRIDVRLNADLLRAASLVRAAGDPAEELIAPYHDRIREAVLGGLSDVGRAAIHLELANAIESSERPDLDALLGHLLAARQSSRASMLAGHMAQIAASSFAFERAAELYGVALSHCAQVEPASRRIELLLARANALRVCFLKEGTHPDAAVTLIELYTRGAGNESFKSFVEAGVRAHALGDVALMAQAALHSEWERENLPYVSRHRDFPEANREILLTWALQAARGEDSPRHVSLLSEMAIVLRTSRHYQRAERCCREAADMANRLHDPVSRLEALRACTHVSMVVDTPPKESLALATTLLNSAQSAKAMIYQADAHFLRLYALTECGEFPEAASEADAVADLLSSEAWIERHGSISNDRVVWSLSLVWRAMRLAMQGHFEDAKRLIRSGPFFAPPNPATLTLNSISMLKGPTQKLMDAYEVSIETEDYRRDALPIYADLERHLRAASEPSGKGEFFQMEVTLRSMLASMYVDADRRAEARAHFERLAAGGFQDLPREFSWLSAMNGIVKTCVYLCDEDRAARLYSMLTPFEDRIIVLSQYNFCFGSFARCLGELATTLGLWSEAARHFDYALHRNTDIGARPFVAMTQAGLARMLLLRGAAGDKAQAQALLAQGSSAASELGMAPLQRELARLRAG